MDIISTKEYEDFNILYKEIFDSGELLDKVVKKNQTWNYNINSKKKCEQQLVANVIMLAISKEIFENIRSIKILVDNNGLNGVSTLVRNSLESFAYFAFIRDSPKQYLDAKRYFYYTQCRRFERISNIDLFKKQIESDGYIQKEYDYAKKEKERIWPNVYSKNKKKIKVQWYGKRSLKELLESLDSIQMFEMSADILYGLLSEETHGQLINRTSIRELETKQMKLTDRYLPGDRRSIKMCLGIINLLAYSTIICTKKIINDSKTVNLKKTLADYGRKKVFRGNYYYDDKSLGLEQYRKVSYDAENKKMNYFKI